MWRGRWRGCGRQQRRDADDCRTGERWCGDRSARARQRVGRQRVGRQRVGQLRLVRLVRRVAPASLGAPVAAALDEPQPGYGCRAWRAWQVAVRSIQRELQAPRPALQKARRPRSDCVCSTARAGPVVVRSAQSSSHFQAPLRKRGLMQPSGTGGRAGATVVGAGVAGAAVGAGGWVATVGSGAVGAGAAGAAETSPCDAADTTGSAGDAAGTSATTSGTSAAGAAAGAAAGGAADEPPRGSGADASPATTGEVGAAAGSAAATVVEERTTM